MALDQQLPEWLYIFVNSNNPMAIMNLKTTGQYSSPVLAALADPDFATAYENGSADFRPFISNPEISTNFMSPFAVGTINNYRVEHDAEIARQASFKDAPSRLTGIFAFESREACKTVNRRWGWPLAQVQRFKPLNVLRATRVNMEIVSLARLAYNRSMLDAETLDQLWRAYWGAADGFAMDLPSVDATQRETHTVGAIWEWLIDGILVHESRIGTQ